MIGNDDYRRDMEVINMKGGGNGGDLREGGETTGISRGGGETGVAFYGGGEGGGV